MAGDLGVGSSISCMGPCYAARQVDTRNKLQPSGLCGGHTTPARSNAAYISLPNYQD